MRKSSCEKMFTICLKELMAGNGNKKYENPAIEFVRDAKRGKYDKVNDNDYSVLLGDADDLDCIWQHESSRSVFQILSETFPHIYLSDSEFQKVVELLTNGYENYLGTFKREVYEPDDYDPFELNGTTRPDRELIHIPKNESENNDMSNEILSSPQRIYDEICKHIHGQREACKAAALLVYQHAHGHRRNVLFIGPTGCGKTEIFRVIKQQNIFPYIRIIDASRITADGWTGDFKVRDIFQTIQTREEAEKTIYIFDEFDKAAECQTSASGTNHSHLVQNSLLRVIEGGEVEFPTESGTRKKARRLDTSKASFVFLGSFDTLTRAKSSDISTIGFGADGAHDAHDAHSVYNTAITQEDLLKYTSMRSEIISRIGKIVQLHPMYAEDFEAILRDDIISPIRKLEREYGIKIYMDRHIRRDIIDEAVASKLGVRYINSSIQDMLDDAMFENPEAKEYYLIGRNDMVAI